MQPVVLSAALYINCTVGLNCLNTALFVARCSVTFQLNTLMNVDTNEVQREDTSFHSLTINFSMNLEAVLNTTVDV